jgi:uncharacterized protein
MSFSPDTPPTKKPVRKRRSHGFLRWFLRSISMILAVILLFLIYVFQIEPNWYDVHQVTFTLPHLPAAFDRYRIVQLSDLHIDDLKAVDRLQKIAQFTNQQQPNLVVLTGDYITGAIEKPPVSPGKNPAGKTSPYETMSHLTIIETITEVTGAGKNRLPPVKSLPTLATGLQQLRAPDGIVAVLGNHDHWTNPQFRKIFQDLNIKVLENDLTQIQRGKDQLSIAGVRDVMAKQADLQPILTKMGAAQGAILLAHEPDFADTSAATGKFDLQLSGHSHGGQVHIPGFKRIAPPLGQKYLAGQYQVQQMIQYTSRGLGLVTPRVRFNCRPELTVITLRSATAQAQRSSNQQFG